MINLSLSPLSASTVCVIPSLSMTDQSYQVRQGGSMSGQCDLVCGVPQGSVVGPLLFLIYTSNVEKLFARHGF